MLRTGNCSVSSTSENDIFDVSIVKRTGCILYLQSYLYNALKTHNISDYVERFSGAPPVVTDN
eukprot:6198922-Pleurochrysis_carterae.AAC.2